jgi:hypothetical protein
LHDGKVAHDSEMTSKIGPRSCGLPNIVEGSLIGESQDFRHSMAACYNKTKSGFADNDEAAARLRNTSKSH